MGCWFLLSFVFKNCLRMAEMLPLQMLMMGMPVIRQVQKLVMSVSLSPTKLLK